MTVTITEKPKSRTLVDAETYELIYLIAGTEVASEALAALTDEAPLASPHGYARDLCRVELVEDMIDHWIGTALYKSAALTAASGGGGSKRLVEGESTISFSTAGGTVRRYVTLATISKNVAAGGAATDHKGSINVTDQGVEGVDLPEGGFSFQIRKCFPAGTITDAWMLQIAALRKPPCRNAAIFHGFPIGTVRFDNSDAGTRADGLDEVTMDFSVDLGEAAVTIGDIVAFARAAWAYVSVQYEGVKDSTSGKEAKRPIQADVMQVFPTGDFTVLGV